MFQSIVLDENWAINCRVPPNDRDSAESEFLFKHVKYSPLSPHSSHESGDSTRTSRTSRKTVVTIGSICSSRDVVFFSEIK